MAVEKICAEVTGTVWKILAQPGDVLEADGAVLVLESMKMEIAATAPEGGRVVSILVAEGEAVSEGQELAIVETER